MDGKRRYKRYPECVFLPNACKSEITRSLSAMMKAFSFFFISLTFAIPAHGFSNCTDITRCEAEVFVDRFANIMTRTGNWTATAKEILCEDFTLVSNSLLSLQGKSVSPHPNPPPSTATLTIQSTTGIVYTNASSWVSHLDHFGFVNVTTHDLMVGECGRVFWNLGFARVGPAPIPVSAMGLFRLRRDAGCLKAERYQVEFDSIASGRGLGLDCSGCVRSEGEVRYGGGVEVK